MPGTVNVPIKAMDPDMASDMSSGSKSDITKMKESLIIMRARQAEDAKYDAPPPPSSTLKEGYCGGFFATASSSDIAIFAALTWAVFAVMVRS